MSAPVLRIHLPNFVFLLVVSLGMWSALFLVSVMVWGALR